MSKKQAVINKFFKPKAKDYVLSSELLRLKPNSKLCFRNKNINNNSVKPFNSNVVISLLSSDEDDEMTSDNEKTSDSHNHTTELAVKLENEETSQVSTSVASSVDDRSDEFVATAPFLDVVLEVQNGSFDTTNNPLLEEITDYKDITDYKLNNFSSMIDWVLNDESNCHLFDEDDWQVIENFKSMSGRGL